MPWYDTPGAEQDVVLYSYARLARNLNAYPFPARLDATGAKEILSSVGAILSENGFTCMDFADISSSSACSLVEKGYASPEFIRESLPHVLYLNEPCGISAMLCGQDHIHLRCIRPGLAIQDAYAGVCGIEKQLDAQLDFAFDERLGYLTHDPGELGCALCISVMLSLPALEAAGLTEALAIRLGRSGISLRRVFPADKVGGGAPLYRLSNRPMLGVAESDILASVSAAGARVLRDERHRRSLIGGSALIRLTDRVYRAAALLRNARILSAGECLCALSDLRLGAALGLISDIRVERLTALLFETSPASLSLSLSQPLAGSPSSGEDLTRDICRARLVQERLA